MRYFAERETTIPDGKNYLNREVHSRKLHVNTNRVTFKKAETTEEVTEKAFLPTDMPYTTNM